MPIFVLIFLLIIILILIICSIIICAANGFKSVGGGVGRKKIFGGIHKELQEVLDAVQSLPTTLSSPETITAIQTKINEIKDRYDTEIADLKAKEITINRQNEELNRDMAINNEKLTNLIRETRELELELTQLRSQQLANSASNSSSSSSSSSASNEAEIKAAIEEAIAEREKDLETTYKAYRQQLNGIILGNLNDSKLSNFEFKPTNILNNNMIGNSIKLWITGLKNTHGHSQEQLKTLEELAEATQTISDLRVEISNLELDKRSLESDKSALDLVNRQINLEITALKNQGMAVTGDSASLLIAQQQLLELEKKLTENTKEYNLAEARIIELNQQISVKDIKIQNTIAEKNTLVTAKNVELATKDAELDARDAEIALLKSTHSTISALEITNIQTKIAELENKIKDLELAKDAYTRDFEDYLKQNDNKITDINALVNRMSNMI